MTDDELILLLSILGLLFVASRKKEALPPKPIDPGVRITPIEINWGNDASGGGGAGR